MTRYDCRLTVILTVLIVLNTVAPLYGQDLNLYMTTSSEVVGPGDRTTYMLTATNTGPTDLTDVSVEIQLPASINRISFPPPNFSCFSGCDANETATWTVGTLGPGESNTVFYRAQIQNAASAGTITSSATASATGASDAIASLDVVIDDSPLLRLSLVPESGPAVANEPFTYTLTFGNTGTINPTDVVLTMPVPDGTSFTSATGGGTESGGVVAWDVGLLGVGASQQVQLTVTPEGALVNGDVLEAVAEIDPNQATEPVARSSVVTPVHSAGPLRLEYALSQTTAEPDGQLTYTLTATNTGPVDLTDASARIQLPGFISRISYPPSEFSCFSGCDANEVATWTIGTLAPGESRTVFFRAFAQDTAPQGEILRSQLTATSSTTGQVLAAIDAHIDPTPLLRLDLAPDPGPAAAGTPFTYTLTIGNVGNNNPLDVALTMPLPEGTSFAEATGGGAEIGGVVTWDIGLVGVGNSKQFRLTVLPDAGLSDGTLLMARATLDSGNANEIVVRSSAVTPIRGNVPLHIAYSLSTTAPGSEDRVDVTLTATNTGPVDLTDASARILFPGSIGRISYAPPDFSCFSGCDANEAATWTIGTLAPGESRTVIYRMTVASSASQGEVLRSMLTATASGASQVSAAAALHVDPSPLLRLSLAPDPAPAVAGEMFTYQLTVGNVGTKNPSGIVLRMPLPEGTNFVAATDGGSLQNDTVVWSVPTLSNGVGGDVEITVELDGSLSNGSLLHARAELDPNDANEVVVRASAATPVRNNVPLSVEYAANVPVVEPNFQFTYTLTVTNDGPVDLTDVEARVLLPGFVNRIPRPADVSCFSGCDANEIATWNVGTLTPGESQDVVFEPTVSSGAPLGNVLRSLVLATATGSNEVVVQRDLFMGTGVPLPVELTAFDATLDGDDVLLQWSTATETNNAGFEVQWRAGERENGGTAAWTTAAFVDGRGTTTEAQEYRYRIERLAPGTYVFRLKQIDFDGASELSPEVEITVTLAEAFALSEAYPNPIQQTGELALSVQEAQHVRVDIFDVLGRHIATLHDGVLDANRAHPIRIDTDRLSSGLYLVRVTAEHFTGTRRVVVAR